MKEEKGFFAMLADHEHISVEKRKSRHELERACWAVIRPVEYNGNRYLMRGEYPTPEEWLHYAVERLYEEGREDLLGSM